MDSTSRTRRADAERPGEPSVPRWVKAHAILTAVLIALLVAVMVFGGGEHGPGRHLATPITDPTSRESAVTGADAAPVTPARVSLGTPR